MSMETDKTERSISKKRNVPRFIWEKFVPFKYLPCSFENK